MGPFANSTQTIESGNSHCGGEVAVRAASDRGFLKIPAEVFGDPAPLFL